jgi:hypothetical protein
MLWPELFSAFVDAWVISWDHWNILAA